MYSDTPLEAPNLTHIELDVTNDDIQKLTHGYQGYIEHDIIDLRKT